MKPRHLHIPAHLAGQRLDRALAQLVRIPAMALVIGVPLIMSLSWTFGLAQLSYGKLNLMTSTLGLVLFGLGIAVAAAPVAFQMFDRAPKGADMIDDFRPMMTRERGRCGSRSFRISLMTSLRMMMAFGLNFFSLPLMPEMSQSTSHRIMPSA